VIVRRIIAALSLLQCTGCDHGTGAISDAGSRDTAMPDAIAVCTAQFAGDFAESATAGSCATITIDGSGETMLALAIPSATLAPEVAASFDLGASPAPGAYSSDSVTTWSARGVQTIGTGACVYNAGTTAVPQGNFAMTLDAVDASSAHGSLSLALWVLAYPGTDCGADNIEQVQVAF
jgi:hypothetical protein